jgi:hypothetical protein
MADPDNYVNFAIINFPFQCSNTPFSTAYGVYIYRIIQFARACVAYGYFSKRGQLLTKNGVSGL